MLNQQLPAPHPEQLRLTDGTVVRKVPDISKTLFCSRDGHFFSAHNAILTDDGWQMNELKHNYNPGKQNHKGGSNYPIMRDFDHQPCHKLIARTWLGPQPAGTEIDHINGDRTDYRADNLQYVTPDENRKRAVILRCLRKAGRDPGASSRRNGKSGLRLEGITIRDPKQMSRDELLKIFASYTITDPARQIEREMSHPCEL